MTTSKKRFVKALAAFLSKNVSAKSFMLDRGNELAKEWSDLRAATPLFGYMTVDETEEILCGFITDMETEK